MHNQLIKFFDQITPKELDSLLSSNLVDEQLDHDMMVRVQTNVLSAIGIKRHPTRTIFWVAAAALIMVLGAGGLLLGSRTLLNSPSDPITDIPPIADSTPSTEKYDAFSDPNVLWGHDEDRNTMPSWLPPGTVIVSAELQKTISSATRENLIPFLVEPVSGHMYFNYPINIEDLALHELLDPEGVLTQLVYDFCENQTWENYNKIRSEYLISYENKYIEPLYSKIYQVRNEIFADLREKYECTTDNTPGWDEWDILWAESLEIAKQDEQFEALYKEYKFYTGLVQNFWYSWNTQQIIGLREQMIRYGFIPVYSIEDAYQAEYTELPYISFERGPLDQSPIMQFESFMLLFVGTSSQISQFEKAVAEQGIASYYLWSNNPMEQNSIVHNS